MTHKINHIAIVVPDLTEALGFWRDALALPVERTEENPGESVNIAFIGVGGTHIELLQPTDAASGIGKYMEKRGPGMHHICIEVDSIEAAMQRLREHNIELINDTPKTRSDDGVRYAFVHPKSTFGVLVELYELPQ